LAPVFVAQPTNTLLLATNVLISYKTTPVVFSTLKNLKEKFTLPLYFVIGL